MSWSNPSQDEASDEYYSAKSKYANAASQKSAAKKAAESCNVAKQQAIANINQCTSDKINFEERIEDIENIIKLITGGGALSALLGSVSEAISDYTSESDTADASYKGSVVHSDVSAASIAESFKSKSVDECPKMSEALQEYQSELQRLKTAVQQLQAQLNQLSTTVDELTSKVASYNAEAFDCTKLMIASAYEMNHYKKYM